MKTKNPSFEVYESFHGKPEWRWRLYARNGEIVAQGEGFTSARDARRAVAAVKRAVRAIDQREAA